MSTREPTPADPSRSRQDPLEHERRRRAIFDAALTLLIHRAGGEVVFTEADYLQAIASYGGPTRINVHFEVVREVGNPRTFHLRLENKPAGNGELPV